MNRKSKTIIGLIGALLILTAGYVFIQDNIPPQDSAKVSNATSAGTGTGRLDMVILYVSVSSDGWVETIRQHTLLPDYIRLLEASMDGTSYTQ